MLRAYILYGFGLFLCAAIAVAYSLRFILEKLLRSIEFRIKIVSFNVIKDLSFSLLIPNHILNRIKLNVGEIRIKREPKSFRLLVYIERAKVECEVSKIGLSPLNAGNDDPSKLIICQNLWNILQAAFDMFDRVIPASISRSDLEEGKEIYFNSEIKGNVPKFIVLLFKKCFFLLLVRVFRVEIVDCGVEVISKTYQSSNESKAGSSISNRIIQHETQGIHIKFYYLQNDVLQTLLSVDHTTVHLYNPEKMEFEKVCMIPSMLAKVSIPIGFSRMVDLKRAKITYIIDEINVSLSEATLHSILTDYANYNFLSRLKSHIKMIKRKMTPPTTKLERKSSEEDIIFPKDFYKSYRRTSSPTERNDSSHHEKDLSTIAPYKIPDQPCKLKLCIKYLKITVVKAIKDTRPSIFHHNEPYERFSITSTDFMTKTKIITSSKLLQPIKVEIRKILGFRNLIVKCNGKSIGECTHLKFVESILITRKPLSPFHCSNESHQLHIDVHNYSWAFFNLIKEIINVEKLYSYRNYNLLINYSFLYSNCVQENKGRREIALTDVIHLVDKYHTLREPETEKTEYMPDLKQIQSEFVLSSKKNQINIWDEDVKLSVSFNFQSPKLNIIKKESGSKTEFFVKALSLDANLDKLSNIAKAEELKIVYKQSYGINKRLFECSTILLKMDDTLLIGISNIYMQNKEFYKTKFESNSSMASSAAKSKKKPPPGVSLSAINDEQNTMLNFGTIDIYFDFLEINSLSVGIKRIHRKGGKSQQLENIPIATFDNIDVVFRYTSNYETSSFSQRKKILGLNSVVLSKTYSRLPNSELFIYNLNVDLNQLSVIIPYEFKSIGAFMQDLAQTVGLIKGQYNEAEVATEEDPDNVVNFPIHSYSVTLDKFDFKLEDSSWNVKQILPSLTGFVRNYLAKETAYNEKVIHDNLKKHQSLPVYLIDFQLLGLNVKMSKPFDGGFPAIMSFAVKCDPRLPKFSVDHFREFTGLNVSLSLEKARLKTRDYIANLGEINKLTVSVHFVKASFVIYRFSYLIGKKKEYIHIAHINNYKVFYQIDAELEGGTISAGLSYLPAAFELQEWLLDFSRAYEIHNAAFFNAKGSSNENNNEILQKMTTSSTFRKENENALKFWDNIRFYYHGNVTLKLSKKLKVNLLTHLFPYSDESLIFSIGTIYLKYNEENFKALIERGLAKRKPKADTESHLLKIPKVEVLIKVNWECKGDGKDHYFFLKLPRLSYENSLHLDLNIHIPTMIEDKKLFKEEISEHTERIRMMRDLVKNSLSTTIHYQSEFLDWILNLPQLRYDMLRLYRINPDELKYDEEQTKESEDKNRSEEKSKGVDESDTTKNEENFKELPNVVYSDFLELFKYTLDTQINRINKDINIFKLISFINVRVHLSNSRILWSNAKDPLVIPQEGEYRDNFEYETEIVGFQTVIDSVTFKCTLVQKKLEINASFLKKMKKKSNVPDKIWKMINGSGKLNFIYCSVFDGISLASLKPQEFETLRYYNFNSSMNNPRKFHSTFELNPANELTLDVSNLSISDMDKIINSLFEDDSEMNPQQRFQAHLFNMSVNYSQTGDPGQGPKRDRNIRQSDFDYESLGVFFKANFVVYEQNKSDYLDEGEVSKEKIEISHCFTLSESKLLITSVLKTIIKNVFFPQSKKMSNIDRKFKAPRKSEAAKKKTAAHPDEKKYSLISPQIYSDIDQSKRVPTKRSVKYMLYVEKPQFNLQSPDKTVQMLLTSKKNCKIFFYKNQLPFDRFQQDLKITVKFCFQDLECFILPPYAKNDGRVQWLESSSSVPHNAYLTVRRYQKAEESKEPEASEFFESDFKKREGNLVRLITCDQCSFEHTHFNLDRCEIDFSQPIIVDMQGDFPFVVTKKSEPEQFDPQMTGNEQDSIAEAFNHKAELKAFFWNLEPRVTSFLVSVGKLASYSDGQSYSVFKRVIEFMVSLVHTEDQKRKKVVDESEKLAAEELEKLGVDKIVEHITSKLEEKRQFLAAKKTQVEFRIQSGNLFLTQEEKPFLNVHLNEFGFSQVFYHDDSGKNDLQIKAFGIKNLDEVGNEYESILSRYNAEEDESNMFIMRNYYIFVQGLTQDTRWKVFQHYEIKIPALTIRLTEDIYTKFYNFLFWEQDDPTEQQVVKCRRASAQGSGGKKNEKSAERKLVPSAEAESPSRKNDKSQINAPSFYRSIRIGDLKASFSYKSKSRLKRLKDIRLAIDPFVSYSSLGNNKIVFDDFVKHVKKRALKLVFSIVGQKIGISSGDIVIGEEVDAKDTEKKRKLLFGDQSS